MIHVTDILSLKAKIHRLKHQLDYENKPQSEKELAHTYLSKALDYINEIQLF